MKESIRTTVNKVKTYWTDGKWPTFIKRIEERYKGVFSPEDQVGFPEREKNYFSPEEQEKIRSAYDFAYEAHSGQLRLTGEEYFLHLWTTAALTLNSGLRPDPVKRMSPALLTSMICAAFLHDTLEDTSAFGDPLQASSYAEWEEAACKRIAETFSEDTAKFVIALTRPKVGVIINGRAIDREEAERIQVERLKGATPEVWLVKMADRLDYFKTFYPKPDKPTPKEKIAETMAILPLFEKAKEKYPKEAEYLLSRMLKQIRKFSPNYGRNMPIFTAPKR